MGISIDDLENRFYGGESAKCSEPYFTNAKIIEKEFGDDFKKVLELIEKGKAQYQPMKSFEYLFETKVEQNGIN